MVPDFCQLESCSFKVLSTARSYRCQLLCRCAPWSRQNGVHVSSKGGSWNLEIASPSPHHQCCLPQILFIILQILLGWILQFCSEACGVTLIPIYCNRAENHTQHLYHTLKVRSSATVNHISFSNIHGAGQRTPSRDLVLNWLYSQGFIWHLPGLIVCPFLV